MDAYAENGFLYRLRKKREKQRERKKRERGKIRRKRRRRKWMRDKRKNGSSMFMHISLCTFRTWLWRRASKVAPVLKNPPASAKDMGSVPGLGRSLEQNMATHSSVLAWRIPWTEEPGRLQSMGSHRVRNNWSDLAHTHHPGVIILRWLLHKHYRILTNFCKIYIQSKNQLKCAPTPAYRGIPLFPLFMWYQLLTFLRHDRKCNF